MSLKGMILFLTLIWMASGTNIPEDGIHISKEYPYYWEYDGEPVLLLGGTNDDNLFQWSFEDKKNHLDSLKAIGGNYIRNTMSDRLDVERYPVSHYAFQQLANVTFDLMQWNETYWKKFKDLLDLCRERDIVVQLEIWDRFDIKSSAWLDHPWRPANNINYTSEETGLSNDAPKDQHKIFPATVPGHPVYESADQVTKRKYDYVRRFQERYVAKILSISLQYDNVLYAMNNETHVDAAWGQYWMAFIRAKARDENVQVLCTDMLDHVWKAEDDRKRLPVFFNNRDKYDYVDISQLNSRYLGETHWDKVMWVVSKLREYHYLTHMTKLYGHDGTKNAFVPGDTDNAREEWWQNLIAGVAGQRFHRPTLGLGLSQESIACIKATRLIEKWIKFWEVEPHMDLLSYRAENEAYLAANPGEKYILYFTNDNGGGASVQLDLTDFPATNFTIHWVSIETGKPGQGIPVAGGEKVTIDRPGPGHWVGAIVKNDHDRKSELNKEG